MLGFIWASIAGMTLVLLLIICKGKL